MSNSEVCAFLYVYTRRICKEFTVNEEEVDSTWECYEGITVRTRIIPTETGHVREHTVTSDRDCIAYDCGFSVEIDTDGEKLTEEKHSAKVENSFSYCEVKSADETGEGVVINADPNTNLLYPMTRIPAVRYEIKKGINVLKTIVTAECIS